jgi:glycine/D-amino acid oxidase-like deaminating enzyme/nitrite reductase/ring-hydroxylating ferredoxin subunit
VDTRLRDLARIHGEEGAKAAWDSSVHAMRLLQGIARDEGIACDWRELDGVLYGIHDGDQGLLAEEQTLARRLGYTCEALQPAEVPFDCGAALRFPAQAKFHPRQFLLGVARVLERRGVRLHETSEVVRVEEEGQQVRVHCRNGGDVLARDVLVTANVPFIDKVRMFTKLYPYRSYVVGARVPRGLLDDALWWSTYEPGGTYGAYYYTRVEQGVLDGDDLVILGGEDHKVGQEPEPEEAWERLEGYLQDQLGLDAVDVPWRWSGQIIENMDGLPYIGANPGGPEHAWIATAFSGNGMTFGALAGWMLAERALGRSTPWDALYDPARKRMGSVREVLGETKDMVAELVKKPLQRSELPGPDALAPGEGALLVVDGEKVAVARTAQGELRACSAVCTHLKCTVRWNRAEGTWDCPCHGSRFDIDGHVVNGPAYEPLKPFDVTRLQQDRGR